MLLVIILVIETHETHETQVCRGTLRVSYVHFFVNVTMTFIAPSVPSTPSSSL
jgi:hypothetical protein